MKKLAIIGASYGQKELCIEASKKGIYTIGFAWKEGAVCRDLFSKFYSISITEKDKIVEICKKENIDGVVSNGSDLTANVSTYVSEKLKLNGNQYSNFLRAQNKFWIRSITNSIAGLSAVQVYLLENKDDASKIFYPCVIKPCVGHSKKGVCFAKDETDLEKAITYAQGVNDEIMLEEFVEGREISVEVLSYKKEHRIIQVTDKDTSGAPHFVELGHHQPALLSTEIKSKIFKIVPQILDAIKYENGATHIEMKIDKAENIYLVEVNLRGGGDNISTKLIPLSTGFNYVAALIDIALEDFKFPDKIENQHYSGIYYLCEQTKDKIKYFINPSDESILESNISSQNLSESKTNYDRNGYLIYCGAKKLILE